MLILITGSTGFIGSQLCQSLVSQGHHVRAFHRPSSPQVLLDGLDVEHSEGDITQPETLERAMQGAEVVFHTAALLGRRPGSMYAVTVTGTRNVLVAAQKAGIRRFIHTSSVAALGLPENGTAPSAMLDESHTWNLRPESWPYGYAKHLAEEEVGKAVAQGLDAVILNPALVVGAGDLNRISGEVIVRVARGQAHVAIPGGLNVVHIDDVVQGHLSALKCGQAGERYILGGENLSHKRFLQIVAEVVKVKPPRVVLSKGIVRALSWPISIIGRRVSLPIDCEALSRVGYYFYYNTRKARQELGMEGARQVRQAVADSYAWYRDQGVL